MTVVKRYGNYIEIECCTECNYALEDASEFYFAPVPNVCPKCGGKTEFTVGRWVYSEKPVPWIMQFFAGFVPETVYHGFERGREKDINHNKIVVEPCKCDGCKISDSGNGYQPCHNRGKLSTPPKEDSRTIDEFMELGEPIPSASGGKWLVCVKGDMFMVLTLARNIKYAPELEGVKYKFDTEMDAHFAAAYYYNQNLGRSYPYFDRLLELTDKQFDGEE